MNIGIIGGTGAAGKALGIRLASLGHEIVIGSRTSEKARQLVSELSETLSLAGSIRGESNSDAARCDLVFFATPWDGTLSVALECEEVLRGKIVVSLVNAIFKVGHELQPIALARGSVAQSLAACLPFSNIVGALHHVPAKELGMIEQNIEADVLVCSDNEDSKMTVINIIDSIPGMNALDAGSLANSGPIEGMTAVLINLNIRYKTRTAIKITGLNKR